MAGGDWWEESPELRSLFPAIVSAASNRADTAGIWQAIRDAASSMAEHILSVTSSGEPTSAEIAAKASTLLSGISASNVSSARGAAGSLIRAREALQNLQDGEQIPGEAIGRPPWAITVGVKGVYEQYRIRVRRLSSIRGIDGQFLDEWSTDMLQGPLTTAEAALRQSNELFGQRDYNRNVQIHDVLDYVIEAI